MPLGLLILIAKLLEILEVLIKVVPPILSVICIVISIILFVKNTKRIEQGEEPKRKALPIVLLVVGVLLMIPIIIIALWKLIFGIIF